MAKFEIYGGKPGVVVATPEISHFKIDEHKHDFVLLGCDGIFDKLTTDQTGKILFEHNQSEKLQMA
jgi:protein phosphatase 2C family protein 2/3